MPVDLPFCRDSNHKISKWSKYFCTRTILVRKSVPTYHYVVQTRHFSTAVPAQWTKKLVNTLRSYIATNTCEIPCRYRTVQVLVPTWAPTWLYSTKVGTETRSNGPTAQRAPDSNHSVTANTAKQVETLHRICTLLTCTDLTVLLSVKFNDLKQPMYRKCTGSLRFKHWEQIRLF